jgi:hypothetical protein
MMKNWIFFISFAAVMLAVSCNKSTETVEATPVQTTTKAVLIKFKINGNEVSEKNYFNDLLPENQLATRGIEDQMLAIAEKYRIVVEAGRLEKDGQRYTVINAFKSDEDLYAYAEACGRTDERKKDKVLQHLADYAISSGAVAAFEASGNVSKDYLDYMDYYLIQNGYEPGRPSELEIRTLTNFVNKDCFIAGSSWPIRTNPHLGMFGYNDQVTSYVPFGILLGGASDIYDNSWFRKRLARIWSWDMNVINFCLDPLKFLDNRATSWATLGLG